MKNGKKIYCTIVSAQWVILSGLRHLSIGSDTYNYKINHFDKIINTPWNTLLNNLWNTYFGNLDIKDPGYALVQKIFQIFSTDYQLFLLFIALIFTVPLGIFIYKNSKEPCMSFLIYSCLFYSFFAVTGHRQTIATALVVLIGYELIKKRKLILFILVTLLAATIHMSCILFFPFYFLYNLKITNKKIIGFFVLAFLMPTILSKYLIPIAELFSYDNQVTTNITVGGTSTYTLLLSIILISALVFKERIIAQNLDSTHYINAMMIAVLFTLATFINQAFMRVQQYYALYIMLLIPEFIKLFEKKSQMMVYFVGASLLIILFVRNNPQYLFFWQ